MRLLSPFFQHAVRMLILATLLLSICGIPIAGVDVSPADKVILQKFNQTVAELLATPLGAPAKALDESESEKLRALASERRDIMKRLIQNNPEAAFEHSINRVQRAKLPTIVQREIEEFISGMGSYTVLMGISTEPTLLNYQQRTAVINGTTYIVYTWGAGLNLPCASNRSLHGVVLDGEMALLPRRLRVLSNEEVVASKKPLNDRFNKGAHTAALWVESGDTLYVLKDADEVSALENNLVAKEGGGVILPSSWTTGSKNMLYMICQLKGESGYPETVAEANAKLIRNNDFYKASSWNKTDIKSWKIIQIKLPLTREQYALPGNGPNKLLEDARAAALAAGTNTDNYSWDAVRFSDKIFPWSGLGKLGGKGLWLQKGHNHVFIHELGHNYGLMHANFWDPIHDSVIGPGINSTYGDIFCQMGVGQAEPIGTFLAYSKWKLDWLPSANLQTITSSGTYRLYTSDSTTPPSGSNKFALLIDKEQIDEAHNPTQQKKRTYWLSHCRLYNNKWTQNGVLLHWGAWKIDGVGSSDRGTDLLDTTPGSVDGKYDAPLVCGRTFSDFDAGIHITPMQLIPGTTPPAIDVVVKMGSFLGNRKPTVSLTANKTAVGINASVNFSITAHDPDGDPLAIYWDFGDSNFAYNTTSTSKSWNAAKDYPVRVTVSDMKGGTASDTIIVRVGSVNKYRLSGKVTINGSLPVEGARVHDGNNANSVWTNSDGTYTLVNLSGGSHTIVAQDAAGTFTAQFSNPVSVGSNVSGKNFNRGNIVTIHAPTVATAAKASPSPITGKTTTLSVMGADDKGESALIYNWKTTGSVPASVSFSKNNTNGAKTCVATFSKAGNYTLLATITDGDGLTVTSAVSVTVKQVNSSLVVTPKTKSVAIKETIQFTVSARDQFGQTLSAQPAFTWSVNGGGTVSSSGLFTAGDKSGGPHTLTVSGGGKNTTATITITGPGNTAPTIAQAAKANPSPVADKSTTLSVLGADDKGESALTYNWKTIGSVPASVNFSQNNTNDAKNSNVKFTQAGLYQFLATISDSDGLTVTSTVTVRVKETYTAISMSPKITSTVLGGKIQFTAKARDQFGDVMTSQPSFTWSVSGGGTISSSGLFTAGNKSGGPHTVTVSYGGKNLQTTLTITDPSTDSLGGAGDVGADDGGKKCGLGNGVSVLALLLVLGLLRFLRLSRW